MIARGTRHMVELERPLRELLRSFTYRPGWEFSVEDGMLRIRAEVIDANNPPRLTPLSFERYIPSVEMRLVGFDWVRWLFDQVLAVERHETMEFFRINGRPVYDPHPEVTA